METEKNFDLISTFKNGRSKSIKFLWIIVLSLSFFGLTYYVRECYVKLKVTPEILISEKLINSRGIPFPAVTICPPFGNKKELIKIKEILVAVSTHFCYTFDSLESAHGSTLKSFNTNLVDLFDTISPQINDILNICTVTGYSNYFGCDQVYTRTLTTFGYCFTFNMLNFSSVFQANISEDFSSYKQHNLRNLWVRGANSATLDDMEKHKTDSWSLQNGYTLKDELIKPFRATKTMRIFTDTREQYHEDYDICEDVYKVIFHLPNEVPTSLDLSTNIEFDNAKILILSAKILQHDETLMQFPPQERGCYFEGERELKFFKSYTKNNCEHECMINYTYSKCGCVKFTMPRTKDMRVCDFEDIKCYFLIFKEWSGSFYENEENRVKYPDYPCNCMPSCTQIKYGLIEKNSDRKFKENKSPFISLNINFGNNQIVKTTHYVPYKLQNFVSDVGGLVGLFLGFSLLSIFEITLKCFSIAHKHIQRLSQNESNQKEVQNVFRVSNIKLHDLVVEDLE